MKFLSLNPISKRFSLILQNDHHCQWKHSLQHNTHSIPLIGKNKKKEKEKTSREILPSLLASPKFCKNSKNT